MYCFTCANLEKNVPGLGKTSTWDCEQDLRDRSVILFEFCQGFQRYSCSTGENRSSVFVGFTFQLSYIRGGACGTAPRVVRHGSLRNRLRARQVTGCHSVEIVEMFTKLSHSLCVLEFAGDRDTTREPCPDRIIEEQPPFL